MSSQPTIIGIIGGGQLGGFLINQKVSQVKYYVYSPQRPIIPTKYPLPPGSPIEFGQHTQGDYHDTQKIVEFGQQCDIITYELENISIEALEILQTEYHKKVYPDPKILKIIQNKRTQKQWLLDHNFPTYKFLPNDFSSSSTIPPPKIVQKLETGGYDGRGVKIIQTTSDLIPTQNPYFLEEYIPIEKELSIIIGRNNNQEIFLYDPVETVANSQHQLDYLLCPAPMLSNTIKKKIRSMAIHLATELQLIGIMAVEFFLSQENNNLYINEISPRPHNTGHHTLDVYPVNQFELLTKCLLNLPLPNSVPPSSPTLMINLIGTDDYVINSENFETSLFAKPNFQIYCYNKSVSFPGRKLGHLTCLLNQPLPSCPELEESYNPFGLDATPKIINLMKHALFTPPSPKQSPLVSIIMGSSSDLSVMKEAEVILQEFRVPYEIKIVSAHRTPLEMTKFAQMAQTRGIKVIIAGAGGAAHLPGMVASLTTLPVIGIPIKSSNSIEGIDSLLSICQMPGGIPVATMAINGAKNGGLLAIRILSTHNSNLQQLIELYQVYLKEKVDKMNEKK